MVANSDDWRHSLALCILCGNRSPQSMKVVVVSVASLDLFLPQSKELVRGPPRVSSVLLFIGGAHIGAVALRDINC
jgi:hypothetical protein